MTPKSKIKIIKMGNGIFQYFLVFTTNETKQENKIFSDKNLLEKETDFITFFKMESDNKLSRKDIKMAKIRFSPKIKIHKMYVWQFAYKQARKNNWEEIYLDRIRFKDRINKTDQIISPILIKHLHQWSKDTHI